MVKEVIGSILEAEKEADSVIKEAQNESRKIMQEAFDDAKKIKIDIGNQLKEQRRASTETAMKTADENYAKFIEKATCEGSEIKSKGSENKDTAVEFIVGRVIS